MSKRNQIVGNVPCPSCRDQGKDSSGDHCMVFSDGGGYCNRCEVSYTAEQVSEIGATTKVKAWDRIQAMEEDEREQLERVWEAELEAFLGKPEGNLTARGIPAAVAAKYGVRLGKEGKRVTRYYYPCYREGKLVGATCRELPKSFAPGLGDYYCKDIELFGEAFSREQVRNGARRQKLVITEGREDAMALYATLEEHQRGGRFADFGVHVWSVWTGAKGGLQEIAKRKQQIEQFKEVLFCFDSDEPGQRFALEACRLIPGAKVLPLPDGVSDANEAYTEGYEEALVDGWFNPVRPRGAKILSATALAHQATQMAEMGRSWGWSELDRATIGIHPGSVYTICGGSGVGKSSVIQQVVSELSNSEDKLALFFLEEHPVETLRRIAGLDTGKQFQLPPISDKNNPDYEPSTDYSQSDLEEAVERLVSRDNLLIVDHEGENEIEQILDLMAQNVAMGAKFFVLDNLTAIQFEGDDERKGIDEAMKALTTFANTHDITLFVVSHLRRPSGSRVPHENGGEIYLSDLRGSGAISFWSKVVIGVERDTQAEDEETKRSTKLRILKCRQNGMSTGRVIELTGDARSGRLR